MATVGSSDWLKQQGLIPTENEETQNQGMYSEFFDDAAAQAGQRAYTGILSDIERRKQAAGQSYSDLYSQAKSAAVRRGGLSDTAGFTGGMAQQAADRVSAAEMAQLASIGGAREQAIGDIEAEKQTAWSDAFLEAAQLQEYKTGQEAAAKAEAQEIATYKAQLDALYDIDEDDLTAEQKVMKAQLESFLKIAGVDYTAGTTKEAVDTMVFDPGKEYNVADLIKLVESGALDQAEAAAYAQKHLTTKQ